jgi:NAD(P)-dependent dehydrogenase (short-subunit alcohol dehydrogenase family)
MDINPAVKETVTKLSRDLDRPNETLVPYVGDVSRAEHVHEAVAKVVSHFGRLDLAVANAGIGGVEADLIDLEPSDFDAIAAVNLRGVYLTCRAAGRVMREAGRGSIVIISSIFGIEPYPRVAAYSATKAGTIAITRAMAVEMAPYKVRVNCIAPGYMATEMQWAGLRARAAHVGITFEEERQRVMKMVPWGRHGTGDDIGAAVAFLASPEADYITGATLGVHGGVIRV